VGPQGVVGALHRPAHGDGFNHPPALKGRRLRCKPAERKRAGVFLKDFLVARLGGFGVLRSRRTGRSAPSIWKAYASVVNTFSVELPTIAQLSGSLHLRRVGVQQNH
jgi:hypothetical protein